MAKRLLLVVSLLVFWLGIVSLVYWMWPLARVELSYQLTQRSNDLQVDTTKALEFSTDVDQILIPKIGAFAEIGWDIDHTNQATYEAALEKGVAHAAVSSYPGEQGNSFLFAHSNTSLRTQRTRNTHFYLLPKLESGDHILIDRDGVRYVYQVTGAKVVDPQEVEYLTQFSPTTTLTLMTCYPLGTSLKRYLVFASLDSTQF